MRTRRPGSRFRERITCVVRPDPRDRRKALLALGISTLRCALGRSGTAARKREGDGATPLGRWRPVEVRFRADRVSRPVTRLPVRELTPTDGWCDERADRNYNRGVRLPYPASAETMWREDHIYDIVVVIDHNARPRMRGRGSAIFVHLARPGYTPTEGCIALSERDMRRLLAWIDARSAIRVVP